MAIESGRPHRPHEGATSGPRGESLAPGKQQGIGGLNGYTIDVVGKPTADKVDGSGKLHIHMTKGELEQMPLICGVPSENMPEVIYRYLGNIRAGRDVLTGKPKQQQ
jgi:hypothetical protein